jgi:hypothetical protein
MRSWRSWPLRIVILASGILALVFIDHYVFRRPIGVSLVMGLAVFGPMLVWRYMEEAEQRRRTSAQQQASNVEEQDASGGQGYPP